MKKRLITVAICSMLALNLAACGGSSYKADTASYTDDYAAEAAVASNYSSNDLAYEEDYLTDGSGNSVDTSTTENASTSNRKLIRTVGISAETKEFDLLVDNITKKINELGGYVENMDSYYGSKYNSVKSTKSATITARIPAKNLDTFLDMMGESSNITNKTENVEDVTLNYVDMDSHKKMLEEERDRLLAFLDEATSIEEIITIEDRLSTVKYQIESMEAQLRTYDNRVDYSTVSINITEVVDYTELVEPEPEKGAWERMTEGFVESLTNVLNGLKEFGIWIVINIPYLIIWAIIIVLIVVFIKKMTKKYKEKEKKRQEELMAKRAVNSVAQINGMAARPVTPAPGQQVAGAVPTVPPMKPQDADKTAEVKAKEDKKSEVANSDDKENK